MSTCSAAKAKGTEEAHDFFIQQMFNTPVLFPSWFPGSDQSKFQDVFSHFEYHPLLIQCFSRCVVWKSGKELLGARDGQLSDGQHGSP